MAAGSYERKSFTGGAQPTALDAAISGTPSSFVVSSGEGATFPTGNDGPFVVVIGRNTATEEKILVASRVNDQFNIQTRGYDDTAAVDHEIGEVVEHVLDASTVDQANNYVNLQTVKGDIVVHDGTNAVVQTVGTNNHVLTADSTTTSGVVWSQVDTANIADNAVTTAKIEAGAVGNTELGSDAVNGDKIADDAVDTEHIADASLGRKAMFPVATLTWAGGTTPAPGYWAYASFTEVSDADGLVTVQTSGSFSNNQIWFVNPGFYYCEVTATTTTAYGVASWRDLGTATMLASNTNGSENASDAISFMLLVKQTAFPFEDSGLTLYIQGDDTNFDGLPDTATTWSGGTINVYKMIG